jgi:hypothetical protein
MLGFGAMYCRVASLPARSQRPLPARSGFHCRLAQRFEWRLLSQISLVYCAELGIKYRCHEVAV